VRGLRECASDGSSELALTVMSEGGLSESAGEVCGFLRSWLRCCAVQDRAVRGGTVRGGTVQSLVD